MYHYALHQLIDREVAAAGLAATGPDREFYARLMANAAPLAELYHELYGSHPAGAASFAQLLATLVRAHAHRPAPLRTRDAQKAAEPAPWFTSNQLAGMSLYVDRFADDLAGLPARLDYLKTLGVNLLHLMPLFQSPPGESDGGYAVSDFRTVDPRFGSLDQLRHLQAQLQAEGFYLMLDIVLNHTSHRHAWAERAKQGDRQYQDYYYFFPDRHLPDQFDRTMPEIFPEAAPGNFTWVSECQQWVMTVFHHYQWDLNYANPAVLAEMVDTIFFYANLGVDMLRIDAPAFIWKQLGTGCQNLPQAHTLLRLIRLCAEVAAPGLALLGEAIVAPDQIMKYFGEGRFMGRECHVAYHATHMALQWDALASGDTRVLLANQPLLLTKPAGATWITYTRCHDDIGLGYPDSSIAATGSDPYQHRKFLKDYYSGIYPNSPAKGALFSVNPKTQDARISGSLAALCGLEKALAEHDTWGIELAVGRLLLMQAHSLLLGGIPMLYYGDEVGYLNDYGYLTDPGKSYDNRWLHRPLIDWGKNARAQQPGTLEHRIYSSTQRLIALRRALPQVADQQNITWLHPHNNHVASYLRTGAGRRLFGVFNFNGQASYLTWYAFKEHGPVPARLHDHWTGETHPVGPDHEYLVLPPYGFALLEDA